MGRALASIQTINSIEPIKDADRIELSTVLGWKCVINKGQFKPGDKAVYFEIDSYLPIRPEFEFMRNSSYKNTAFMGEGFRLRTQTFRGQVSQGLLLPISSFPELPSDIEIGTDVTELLGVRKYEVEVVDDGKGTIIGALPRDIPSTHETRIQSAPELINEFADLEYYISTKMDGMSCSIGIDDDGFHVTGHDCEYADDGKSDFYELIKARGYNRKLAEFAKNNNLRTITIQGEFCGPGIQKNRIGLKDFEWYVFTIRENGERVGLNRMLEICSIIGCTSVPIEAKGKNLQSVYPTIDSLLKRADGNYHTGNRKEGIVIRPITPVFSKTLNSSLSMKVINNTYLLKNKE